MSTKLVICTFKAITKLVISMVNLFCIYHRTFKVYAKETRLIENTKKILLTSHRQLFLNGQKVWQCFHKYFYSHEEVKKLLKSSHTMALLQGHFFLSRK